MKIEKLPSGSYRIRKMYKGKTYSVVFDFKPTQKEAIQAMADELDKVKNKHKSMTFQAASEEYIESKRNVLSPSTILGYKKIIKQISDNFLKENIHDITTLDVQSEINRMSKKYSPKTVRNHHGFISAVLGTFCPNLKICTTLPQKLKNEPYTPSREDVKRILEKVKGTEYEIPITLACYGLRRSEICALTVEDLEDDILHINKALVQDENQNWVVKTTKTTSSTRNIIIPTELADKIRKKGFIYNGHPNQILKYLTRIETELNIPHFSLHKLRHYFASEMSYIGIPEADILSLGGWETDTVMKTVYRHSMMDKKENAKREAAHKFHNAIFS
jgi:integrase